MVLPLLPFRFLMAATKRADPFSMPSMTTTSSFPSAVLKSSTTRTLSVFGLSLLMTFVTGSMNLIQFKVRPGRAVVGAARPPLLEAAAMTVKMSRRWAHIIVAAVAAAMAAVAAAVAVAVAVAV